MHVLLQTGLVAPQNAECEWRIAAAPGHAIAGHRVEHPVARPCQPAPWPGQGWIPAARGHTLPVQRVGHPVARPSPPAPWPGQGRIAAALGRAMMVVVPRVAVGS